MRRYNIISVILLILSIIDFTLAAPVLVQEKRRACVDVVHIPRDVITVLGKRVNAERLEKLLEEFSKAMEKPAESSDAHVSSSPAPPRPDHGSNVVQASAPNPASSTANPNPLIKSWNPSSIVLESSALPTKKRPWTIPVGPDLDDWILKDPLPKRPELGKMLDLGSSNPDSGWGGHHIYGDLLDVNPFTRWTKPAHKAVTPFTFLTKPTHEDVTPFTLWEGPAHKDVTPFTLSAKPEHEGITPFTLSEEPAHKDVTPFTVSTDSEIHLDHQSLSTDSQPVDLQAAIHAAKGKAKESRRISGPTRDIGNAA